MRESELNDLFCVLRMCQCHTLLRVSLAIESLYQAIDYHDLAVADVDVILVPDTNWDRLGRIRILHTIIYIRWCPALDRIFG